MKLRTIAIKNFGSFHEATIDLSTVAAAVITGSNGSGKSTGFVDAPLWALFGKCRTSPDQMLCLGATDMAVTVEFQLNTQRYRVIRKRSLATKAGKSELALQIANGDSWEDASGARLADTQQKIQDLLNGDYDLLVATGVLIQGQADRFSRATPTERKAILAQILRLDQYGPLKQAASRHGAIAETKAGERQTQLRWLTASAETIPGLEARQLELTAALTQSEQAIEQLEKHQQELTTKKATLSAELEQLNAIPGQIATLTATRSALMESTTALTARRERAAKILGNRSMIEAKVAEEQAVRVAGTQLEDERATLASELASAQQRLKAEDDQLQAIPVQLARLQFQHGAVQEQIRTLRERRERSATILGNRATIEAKALEEPSLRQAQALCEEESANWQRELDDISRGIENVHRELLAGLELLQVVDKAGRRTGDLVTAYDVQTRQLQEEIQRDEKQTGLLAAVPCDTTLQKQCLFTVSAIQIQTELSEKKQRLAGRWDAPNAILEHEYPTELKVLTEAQAALDAWVKLDWDGTKIRLEGRRAELLTNQSGVKKRIETLKASLLEVATFTVLIPELNAADREVDQIDRDLSRLGHDGEQIAQDLAELERRRLEQEDNRARLNFEVGRLTAAQRGCDDRRQAHQQTLTELAKFTVLVPELAAAERELVSVEQDLSLKEAELGRIVQELYQLQVRHADLDRLVTELQDLTSSLQQDTVYLAKLRTDSHLAIGRLKELELELKQAQEASVQARDLQRELDGLAVDQRQFQALATAYSQIPVLILESSIPLLEDEANRILGKISTSGLRVTFNTQKALKSRDGLAETLDIAVRDVFGERMLENYSGGERARVDLAIRIGLSKLLANRAGARLETLIVDEAFAAVDREGVEQLVECLPMLSEEFPLILFVTHDESFKSAITQQIVVTKTQDGSKVEVLA